MVNLSKNKKNKKLKGYSLAEILVSLGIVSVLLLMLFSTIVTSLKLTIRATSRGALREEMSSVIDALQRDVRNSSVIVTCGGESCVMMVDDREITWSKCESSICRYGRTVGDSSPAALLYQTSEDLEVTIFTLESAFIRSASSEGKISAKENILITIVANHSNSLFNISNLTRQESISTRNYEL